MVFEKKEVAHLIIASIVLGFVLGFDDKQAAFDPQHWITNLILVTAASFLVILVYSIVQKCAAACLGAEAKFRIWLLHQLWFKRTWKSGQGLPLGVILPLLITVVSFGRIPFAAVASSEVQTVERLRFGKKFREITDFERAAIIAAGPLTMLVIAVLMPLFDTSAFALLIRRTALTLAIAQMLPLPNTEGIKIFTSSSALYIFLMAFLIAAAFLITNLSSALAIILPIAIACILLFCYWFFIIFKK